VDLGRPALASGDIQFFWRSIPDGAARISDGHFSLMAQPGQIARGDFAQRPVGTMRNQEQGPAVRNKYLPARYNSKAELIADIVRRTCHAELRLKPGLIVLEQDADRDGIGCSCVPPPTSTSGRDRVREHAFHVCICRSVHQAIWAVAP